MLLNINSKYNIELIFSYIEYKQRLEIIIYNKKLQEILNININYYKGISQKILEINKNGIGTIYDLISNEKYFEGEYSNKKKNGKGIIYVDGNKYFEGEYKNGKKMDMVKNIVIMLVHYYLKVNIKMEKEMDMEKNMIVI